MFPVSPAVCVDNGEAMQKAVLETNRTEADPRGDVRLVFLMGIRLGTLP